MNASEPTLVDNDTGLPSLPPRHADSHKGDCGRLLVIAGSPGMTGAGVLAARGALRAGAGLVTLACPRSLEPSIAARLTSAMSLAVPDVDGVLGVEAAEALLAAAARATAVALGPGLGRAESTRALVRVLLARIDRPLVVDADALVHLAADPQALVGRVAPCVLTPHPGEMAALCGIAIPAVQARRAAVAADLARRWRVVVALKGAGTIVTAGDTCWRNRTGNPGMATAGTGDVLTGIVGALLAQGMPALEAARLAVHTHGLAGDLAAAALGQHGVVADDVVDRLPAALVSLGSPTGKA